MFSLFKPDPAKKLQKRYEEILTKAMQAQRDGDIRTYSTLTEEADKLLTQLDALRQSRAG